MRKTALAMIALAASALPACAQTGERAEQFFVAPGKYILYDCAQLAAVEVRYVERDKELKRLIARAKEGPAGGLISTFVYDPDYYSNLGELHDVQREQRAKNCAPDTKPAKLLDKPQDKKKR
jgi:hypothetical protein